MALIEARGVLSKDALMARVWRDRVVEEKNGAGLRCAPSRQPVSQ
jgi:DNA-binding winged helix-turn-helix (wHTH) protein